ncbi:transcriptional regulator, partial [Listeria monocytogenes]|nr:transcriptional regulator [Listeria monocytogenes]
MELLRYSFASINYRYFLLDNLINKFNNIVPGYTNLDRNIRKIHKVNHLEPLISQLVNLKEMDSLKPFEERLASDYLIILDKRIDFSIHTLP